MTRTTKRKNIKPSRPTKKTPAKRKRNAVNFLLSDVELAEVTQHMQNLRGPGSAAPPLKLGSYAKHAMLEYPRLVAVEGGYRALADRIARPLLPNTMQAVEPSPDGEFGRVYTKEIHVGPPVNNPTSDGEPTFGSDDHSELGAGDA